MRTAATVLATAVLATTARAQALPPLAGPRVDADRPARLEQGLTDEMPGPARSTGRALPLREIERLLRTLADMPAESAADPTLALTDAQEAELTRTANEHRDAVRRYREANAAAFRELRAAAGTARNDAELTQAQRDARAKLRELTAAGPADADVLARFYALLTEPQRAWLDAEVQKIIDQRARDRGMQRYQDELNAPRPDPATFFNDDGTVNLDALPPQLRQRIERLPEDQRAARLRATLQRLERLRPGNEGDRRSKPVTTDKPAPDPASIPAPAPD
jgi:hypothetical protein